MLLNVMEPLVEILKKALELAGFADVSVDKDVEGRKIRVFINEGDWIKAWVPELIANFETLLRLFAQKRSLEYVFVDINNYRKERERLIVEIAKAAARKALVTKGEVALPAMNAYERRLVHNELGTRPDVKTESIGLGPGRYVVVKPL